MSSTAGVPGYLLDTNAISEFTKPRPNQGFVEWRSTVPDYRLYLSVFNDRGTRLRH
jgi:predicted nucleic acid-binding protein